MKNLKIEAFIIALGLGMLGFFVYCGICNFTDKDRSVSVKGLAEVEVSANRVILPLIYKDMGNDLAALYESINAKNAIIISFLKANGISDKEINAPSPNVTDMAADRYATENKNPYRYYAQSVITVATNKVDVAMKILSAKGELLKKGIALTQGEYDANNVQYIYTGLNSIKPKMIEEATKNARATAEKFAKDSDSKLGKIKSASQGQFTISDRDMNTPNIKIVRVVTTVDYYLKD